MHSICRNSWAIHSRALPLILLLLLPVISGATTFAVTTYSDSIDKQPGDGICKDQNGQCSLRAAVDEGESTFDSYTINAPAGQYELLYGAIRIKKAITIKVLNTEYSQRAAIKCSPKRKDIVFTVRQGGKLFAEKVDISNCRFGLAIDEGGVATIRNAKFSRNERAISNFGSLLLNDSRMRGNSNASEGSALYNYGTARLWMVFFENNHSNDRGGALYNAAPGIVHAQLVHFKSNSAVTAGGAIFNKGELSLDFIRFEGNSALAGGAIENASIAGKKPLISRSSLIKNEATGNLADQCGGAIRNSEGVLYVANSTMSENYANGNGSALCTINGTVNLGNITVTKNIANRNFNEIEVDGGALFGHPDRGAIYIRNSIVAGNQAGGDGTGDCAGSLISKGHNIIGILGEDHCTFTEGNNDLLGTADNPIDAGLLPIAYKLTAYHGLSAGSPAINSADNALCMSEPYYVKAELTDQNEIPHDDFGACDRGSVEFME